MPLYNDITLLVTHFNRSRSLERLLDSLKKLDLQFQEIIVSDDGSRLEHLDYLTKLQNEYQFSIVPVDKENKSLGNNINKGQKLVKTAYTLYIQEDFVAQPELVEKLDKAHQFLEKDQNLDFVRFHAYFEFPNLKPVSDGFLEMQFSQAKFWQGYRKFYLYSDHPHLRRTNFFERFGEYKERIRPDRTEYKMMMQVLAASPKAYIYQEINVLLKQENSEDEPSTIKRNFLRNNNHFFASTARIIYRYLRFNLDLIIYKIKRKTYGRRLI